MTTSAHQRGDQGKNGQSTSRIIVISALFLAVLGTAWLIGREFVVSDIAALEQQYRGVVQLTPDEQRRCEQFEYDNRTGYLQPKGVAPCKDTINISRSRSPTTQRQLGGIIEYFKSR